MKASSNRSLNVIVMVVRMSLLLLLLLLLLLSLLQQENDLVVDGFALFPCSTAIMKRSRARSNGSGQSSSSSSSSSSRSLTTSNSMLVRPADHFTLYSQKKGSNSDSDSQKSDNDNEKDDSWDSGVDYEKDAFDGPEQQESPDPGLPWGSSNSLAELPEIKNAADLKTKLGINIGSMLQPLSDQQAAELRAAATEVINDRVAAGLDDIAALRLEMQQQIDKTSREMQQQSQRQAEMATNSLLSKIDTMTDKFLKSTQASRLSVKQAAAADRNSAISGRGVEMGSWGKLGGADVSVATTTTTSSTTSSSSSGSRSTTFFEDPQEETKQATTRPPPKLLVVADTKQDEYAKLLIEPLTKQLSNVFAKDSDNIDSSSGSSSSSSSGVQVNVYAPTATLPLGGDNAAALLLFLTSFSSPSSVKNALDRLLRKTLSSSSSTVSMPPTQIVAISTVGTERTNTMPYSMQNMLGGGKLDQRRQMEEAVMNIVNTRVTTPPSLDYTILKLGDKLVVQREKASSNIKNKKDDTFELKPGDVLDGPCQVDTAVQVLLQAIALQPAARNSTLCAVGARRQQQQANVEDEQAYWDDVFVPLLGPEVWRYEGLFRGDSDKNDETFVQLAEYIREWATLPSTSEKLTTPVQVVENPKISTTEMLPIGVQQQVAIQFLYLPTATGSNYMSKEEERAREKESSFNKPSSSSSSSSSSPNIQRIQARKLGGLEILVEQHCSSTTSSSSRNTCSDNNEKSLRIRARRCNYAPGAVLKELTEDSLIARLRKSVEVWKNNHAESSSR